MADTKAPKKRPASSRRIVGVDGEGHDTPDGGHIYVYLAAVDEDGRLVAEAHDPNGLSHEACVRMLLSIPQDCLTFGFMFSYDVTKIVEAMPPEDIYYLMRPNARAELQCKDCRRSFEREDLCPFCGSDEIRGATRPVRYRGRLYDYFVGSLEVKEPDRKTKVWDCFRFFGCAFVSALDDWKIGTVEQVERIASMKGKRGALEREDPEDVKRYCREECELLAKMMRKVIDAHEQAGIPLERFDGAGSTASSLLKANNVSAYKGPRHSELDPALARAIECAFFGGRFEDSVVGIVEKPVYGFDISSAYPFALSALPCLACGTWRKVDKATPALLERHPVTVAAFRVRNVSAKARAKIAWCPLPCRDDKGSIAYGLNFSGWAWAPELLAALRGWPELVELSGEAWVYETTCGHMPFEFLPAVYRKRVEWGKEGAGKALKLGSNASYGKTAQSVGEDPPFQSWPWAGMTTATTRGQLLDAICSARDPWNVLTVATDGIYALEDLPIKDPPRDTGTSDLPKPLGGWERKELPEGVFVAKPGLYYRLETPDTRAKLAEIRRMLAAGVGERDPRIVTLEKEIQKIIDVRARGVGRREVFAARSELEKGFLRWDRRDMEFSIPLESRRFWGAKHSIYARSRCSCCGRSWPGVPEQGCPDRDCKLYDQPGTDFTTSMIEDDQGRAGYGRWGLRTVEIAFDPHPKRERVLERGGTSSRLRVRDLEDISSAPYPVGKAKTTPEGERQRDAKDVMLEQPDWEEGIALGRMFEGLDDWDGAL